MSFFFVVGISFLVVGAAPLPPPSLLSSSHIKLFSVSFRSKPSSSSSPPPSSPQNHTLALPTFAASSSGSTNSGGIATAGGEEAAAGDVLGATREEAAPCTVPSTANMPPPARNGANQQQAAETLKPWAVLTELDQMSALLSLGEGDESDDGIATGARAAHSRGTLAGATSPTSAAAAPAFGFAARVATTDWRGEGVEGGEGKKGGNFKAVADEESAVRESSSRAKVAGTFVPAACGVGSGARNSSSSSSSSSSINGCEPKRYILGEDQTTGEREVLSLENLPLARVKASAAGGRGAETKDIRVAWAAGSGARVLREVTTNSSPGSTEEHEQHQSAKRLKSSLSQDSSEG